MLRAYLIAVVGMVSSGVVFGAVDYRTSGSPRLVKDPACVTPGLMCSSNCYDVVSCVRPNPSKPTEMTSTVIQTCNSSSWCLNGACVPNTQPNPLCDSEYSNFQCPDYGMFPDPADCKKFHMCIPGTFTEYPGDCDPGYGYNARTKVCDKKLTNNKCIGYPVPLCLRPQQQGPLPENPNIYYICVYRGTNTQVLYPNLYVCPNGRSYYAGRWSCL